MQLKPRILALALGLALAPFSNAFAQDIELVTEATVTFQATFGTSITTNNGQTGVARIDTTRAYNTVVPNPDIIRSVLGVAPGASITGWRFVAARPAPGDSDEIDTTFLLYLVNESVNPVVRQLVPADKFFIYANNSVENSAITHSTRNIITGKGIVTNHARMDFTPTFTRKDVPAVITGPFTENVNGTNRTFNISTKTESAFTLDSLSTTGFSTISFAVRSTGEPVFFFAIDRMRFTSRGDFSGTLLNTVKATKKYTTRGIPEVNLPPVVDEAPSPGSGLISIQVDVTAAKLVPRTYYPEVSFY